MVFKERNPGLWELELEIGNYFAVKKEEVVMSFRGPYNDEYNKLIAVEGSMIAADEKGIEITFKDDDGKKTLKKVSIDALEKRSNHLANLVSKCMKDHNIFLENEKGVEQKLTNREAWAWVLEKPALVSYIIETWRTEIPLAKENAAKQK